MARVSSILQSNGTTDTRSKSTYVLLGHPILFDNMFDCPFMCLTCLFTPVWISLLMCLFACSLYFFVIPFACLLAALFVCCMYMHGARTLGARAQPPRCKQQGQGMQVRSCKPKKGNVQQIRSQLLPSGSLSLSFLASSLELCIRVSSPCNL